MVSQARDVVSNPFKVGHITMRTSKALLSSFVVVCSSLLAAQGQEFARVLRNGDDATLSVFGPRPVDLAAKKLVDEFGVAINVEDPMCLYRDDAQDVTPPHLANSSKRVLIPKASLLEMRLDLRPNGSLKDVRQLVETLADTANAQLPFLYRVDREDDAFTLVPTRTRGENGRSVKLTPILDRRVTIPLGMRKISEHITLLTQALEQQTGVRVSCCQAAVSGIPWGSTVVSFEARDEPARHGLLRLLRSEPERDRFVRRQEGGPSDLVKGEPEREHWRWSMKCQPGESWCFFNVAPMPAKP